MDQSTLDIKVQAISKSKLPDTDFSNLKFGETFADHQLEMNYQNGKWQAPEIKPYGKIEVMPSMNVLHYGQSVFEGLKAFRYGNQGINLFRLDQHIDRFNISCRRMNIPEIDKEIFSQSVKALVDLDRDWVPTDRFKSLYIRPFVFGSDESLGVKTCSNYRFLIITSPVGNYYSEGIKPVSLTTMPEYSRAVAGGAGFAKVPGNYAATLLPGTLAQKKGYTQVLWLDAIEHKYIEEVGTMNMFFVIDDKLITPPAGKSILLGVTRKSVMELANRWGIDVDERKISIDELIEASKSGKLQEAFGTGTAAVISPVGLIHHEGNQIELGKDEMGPVAKKFYDEITGIQHGEINDTLGWCHII
ncbi:MAG: branched-chain amino acid aminotransferase [Balneolales bacterium]